VSNSGKAERFFFGLQNVKTCSGGPSCVQFHGYR
jgi:hypothetical protein